MKTSVQVQQRLFELETARERLYALLRSDDCPRSTASHLQAVDLRELNVKIEALRWVVA